MEGNIKENISPKEQEKPERLKTPIASFNGNEKAAKKIKERILKKEKITEDEQNKILAELGVVVEDEIGKEIDKNGFKPAVESEVKIESEKKEKNKKTRGKSSAKKKENVGIFTAENLQEITDELKNKFVSNQEIKLEDKEKKGLNYLLTSADALSERSKNAKRQTKKLKEEINELSRKALGIKNGLSIKYSEKNINAGIIARKKEKAKEEKENKKFVELRENKREKVRSEREKIEFAKSEAEKVKEENKEIPENIKDFINYSKETRIKKMIFDNKGSYLEENHEAYFLDPEKDVNEFFKDKAKKYSNNIKILIKEANEEINKEWEKLKYDKPFIESREKEREKIRNEREEIEFAKSETKKIENEDREAIDPDKVIEPDKKEAGAIVEINPEDIKELPENEVDSGGNGNNGNEKLAELERELENARREYIEMDYKVDKESSRLRSFFGLKRIDLGIFEKSFKESKKRYEIALNNYLAGMAESKVDAREITEYLYIKETAERKATHEQIKMEKSPNFELLKKGWKGIAERYKALPMWKKVAYGTALGTVAGFGAGAGLGIAIGGTTGTIAMGAYRAFCAAASVTGFKGKYEAKAEKRQQKKNEERIENIIKDSRIEGQGEVQIDLLMQNLDKKIAKINDKIQKEKQQKRWRTFRAAGMTTLFAGAGYYFMGQHQGSSGAQHDIETHQPEIKMPVHDVGLASEQIKEYGNLASDEMKVADTIPQAVPESELTPGEIPDQAPMEKALLEDYAKNNGEIPHYEAPNMTEAVSENNTEYLQTEESVVKDNISSETHSSELTPEEMNKIKDYEDLANQEMKVGDTIPKVEPEGSLQPKTPADSVQPEMQPEPTYEVASEPLPDAGHADTLKYEDAVNKEMTEARNFSPEASPEHLPETSHEIGTENAQPIQPIAPEEPEIKIEKDISQGDLTGNESISGKVNELIGSSDSVQETVANFRRELFLGNREDWDAMKDTPVVEAMKDKELKFDLKQNLNNIFEKSANILGKEASPIEIFGKPETLDDWTERVCRLMMEKR